MNQALIKTLLESSLPLRLALLDADPAGAGWLAFRPDEGERPSAELYQRRRDDAARRIIEGGGVFLPCNPLAIERHAVRIASTNPLFRYRLRAWDMDNGRVAACIHIVNQDGKEIAGIGVDGANDYECAVALLREVVG